jgi:hypothetical protein
MRLGRPQGHTGWEWKIIHPLGFDPWTVQPIASSYTDNNLLAHILHAIMVYMDMTASLFMVRLAEEALTE